MNQHPTEWFPEGVQFFAGIGLLSLALVVSAWLGLWQEETYRLYGKKWREALFYSVSYLNLSTLRMMVDIR